MLVLQLYRLEIRSRDRNICNLQKIAIRNMKWNLINTVLGIQHTETQTKRSLFKNLRPKVFPYLIRSYWVIEYIYCSKMFILRCRETDISPTVLHIGGKNDTSDKSIPCAVITGYKIIADVMESMKIRGQDIITGVKETGILSPVTMTLSIICCQCHLHWR
jgi:hypothetical protein